MKTVVFLGAGAARAQYDEEARIHPEDLSAKLREGEKILPPPVDSDFVKWGMERCVNNWPCVAGYFEAKYEDDLFEQARQGQIGLGMEWVFVRLFRDAHARTATRCAKLALHNLLVAYRKLIAVSTMVLDLTDRTAIPALFEHVRRNSDLTHVCTTNQDLLLERTLEHNSVSSDISQRKCVQPGTGSPAVYESTPNATPRQPSEGPSPNRRRTVCDVFNCYHLGVCFEVIRRSDKDAKNPRRRFDVDSAIAVPLLKLHGSFNWWYESQAVYDPTPHEEPGKIYISCEKDPAEAEPVEWSKALSGDKADRLYPFIVPPVEEKERLYLRGLLKPIWSKAKGALAECERLVVFGYSFPTADCDAADLFREHLNKDVREVAVIDLCCTPAKKLRAWGSDGAKHYGPLVKWFQTVDDYLAGRETEF